MATVFKLAVGFCTKVSNKIGTGNRKHYFYRFIFRGGVRGPKSSAWSLKSSLCSSFCAFEVFPHFPQSVWMMAWPSSCGPMVTQADLAVVLCGCAAHFLCIWAYIIVWKTRHFPPLRAKVRPLLQSIFHSLPSLHTSIQCMV